MALAQAPARIYRQDIPSLGRLNLALPPALGHLDLNCDILVGTPHDRDNLRHAKSVEIGLRAMQGKGSSIFDNISLHLLSEYGQEPQATPDLVEDARLRVLAIENDRTQPYTLSAQFMILMFQRCFS